jgi:hypothetical protein
MARYMNANEASGVLVPDELIRSKMADAPKEDREKTGIQICRRPYQTAQAPVPGRAYHGHRLGEESAEIIRRSGTVRLKNGCYQIIPGAHHKAGDFLILRLKGSSAPAFAAYQPPVRLSLGFGEISPGRAVRLPHAGQARSFSSAGPFGAGISNLFMAVRALVTPGRRAERAGLRIFPDLISSITKIKKPSRMKNQE